MADASLRVQGDEPIGTISPRLYGHVAEHLGRCCYDGLWVGRQQTEIPADGRFHNDVVALEGFHRQCRVLTLANLVQIVNVLQAPVMTDGASFWRTPTYDVFQLHPMHLNATALPIDVTSGPSPPDGASAISGTVSQSGAGVTITLINAHRREDVEISVGGVPRTGIATGQILTASTPAAENDATSPGRVVPIPLSAFPDGAANWRVTLPPHSIATI